jgi:hypothetical protein
MHPITFAVISSCIVKGGEPYSSGLQVHTGEGIIELMGIDLPTLPT